MMKRLTVPLAALVLATAMPTAGAAPSPAPADKAADPGNSEKKNMAEFAAFMGGLFQAEPLTAEQEARLPAAQAVVGAMMPKGFYGKMMSDMMDRMMRPMMSMLAKPEFQLTSRLDMDSDAIEKLGAARAAEAIRILDPAYDRRAEAAMGVISGKLGGAFGPMEEPMREGLAKAYAARFDKAQLADIAAFFATPTGSTYARESMALFSDPRVMQASMKALPQMLSGFGDMEAAMNQAMASLPAERAYSDLSASERQRLAEILNVSPSRLPEIVRPPKPGDSGKKDGK